MTADELKRLFPRASADFLDANAGLPRPVAQPAVCDGTLGAAQGKGAGTGKRYVRVTSYRARWADADNLCVKYVVDALRYAGLIVDDSPDHIELTVAQKKVKHRREEKTLIEIH